MSVPRTLGDLRRSNFSEERLRTRHVKDELRDNLVARLREERKYPTLDELKAQIARDVEEARELTAPLVAAYGAVGPFG